MLGKTALLSVAGLAFALGLSSTAAAFGPMASEIGTSRLAGIEPTDRASAARLGPPAAPVAAQRAADCPDAVAPAEPIAPAASAPDAGRMEPKAVLPLPLPIERKPVREWRWKSLLPGALK